MTVTAPTNEAGARSKVDLDPVTFEVVRHRLWAINDDQGRMAARLSASTTVYELNDFNSAVLTADGRGLCSGAYIMSHATTVASMVQLLLQQFDLEDIHEGDLFYTNDPWCGALHANDGLLALPIFWHDRLVAWSVIVMHDDDVGSPVPSSLVVGARDRFGEAPLFPIFKLGHDFVPRDDLLATLLRNSRLPLANEQNMRARVAALRTGNTRLQELIDEYGIDVFLAAQEELIDYVVRVLRTRLQSIPDGTWYSKSYHDNDSLSGDVFPICCRLSKRGDHLTFDMTGTSPQVPGPVNTTRLSLNGAILGSLLATLCTDLPWVCGAVSQVYDLVADDGTIVTAVGAAPVSMGSFMATFTTNDVIGNVMAKMLQSSTRYRSEAQANWSGGISGAAFVFPDRNGQLTINLALDALGGGGGARTMADGIDSGGLMESPATRISNVEAFEARAPLLEIYRRESADSGGPGRYRGGAGLEFAMKPHKAGGPGSMATMASGFYLPAGLGLSGGQPNAAASVRIFRDSDVTAALADGRVAISGEEIAAEVVEAQEPKSMAFAGPEDTFVAVVAGGSGFGDPLRRDPGAVASDVRSGLVSAVAARTSYGVVVDTDGSVDDAATQSARAAALDARRSAARPQADEPSTTVDGGEVLHPVSDAVEAVTVDGARHLRCTLCHHRYGDHGVDHKARAMMADRELVDVNPGNSHCRPEFVLREFYCPGCMVVIAADVQLRDEPVRPESSFF